MNYIEGGIRLGGWGSVGVRHNLLLKGEARIPLTINILGDTAPFFSIDSSGMTLNLAQRGGGSMGIPVTIAFYGGVNGFPYRIGKLWAVPPGEKVGEDAEGKEGVATSPSITDLYGGLSVAVGFKGTALPVLQDMGITFDTSWRTNGATLVNNNNAGYRPWKIDDGEALKYNGKLRVQATINYAPTSRLSSYLRFRYEYSNILPLPQGTYSIRDRALHDYYVMAGVSYKLGGEK